MPPASRSSGSSCFPQWCSRSPYFPIVNQLSISLVSPYAKAAFASVSTRRPSMAWSSSCAGSCRLPKCHRSALLSKSIVLTVDERAGGRARIPSRVGAPRSVNSHFPQSDETNPACAVSPADWTHIWGMKGPGRYAARRSYRRWKPPTSEIATMRPTLAGCTGLPSGVSLPNPRCVRLLW
jgi:hypothetical protein